MHLRVSLLCLFPHIAIKEGIRSIRNKRQRRDSDVREYRRWAASQGALSEDDSQRVIAFLAGYGTHVTQSLRELETAANDLESASNFHVYALTDEMLEVVPSVKYMADLSHIKPIDEAILGAVLGKADELRASEPLAPIYFCTTDSDLRPIANDRRERKDLKALYDKRQITVLSDFAVPKAS